MIWFWEKSYSTETILTTPTQKMTTNGLTPFTIKPFKNDFMYPPFLSTATACVDLFLFFRRDAQGYRESLGEALFNTGLDQCEKNRTDENGK